MNWLLILSVVLNIALLIVIAFMAYAVATLESMVASHQNQQEKWESRWYRTQILIREKFNYHLHPDGLRSDLELEDLSVTKEKE